MVEELWKPVVGFEGRYEVSNLGKVHSLITDKTLKPGLMTSGYLFVALRKDGKTFNKSIHRTVLEAFVGKCEDGFECCHNDGNRTHNTLDNLRWGTNLDNINDKKKHSTFFVPNSVGENNGNAKLSDSDVAYLKLLLAIGISSKCLSALFGISATHVSRIKLGKFRARIAA